MKFRLRLGLLAAVLSIVTPVFRTTPKLGLMVA